MNYFKGLPLAPLVILLAIVGAAAAWLILLIASQPPKPHPISDAGIVGLASEEYSVRAIAVEHDVLMIEGRKDGASRSTSLLGYVVRPGHADGCRFVLNGRRSDQPEVFAWFAEAKAPKVVVYRDYVNAYGRVLEARFRD